jgi:dimethylglycine dehydrogenase
VTSGGFGHFVNRSLAQGYVPVALAADLRSHAFDVEILGERRPASILVEAPFDPSGARMRM